MSYQSIGVGTLAGDGTGDTLRVGGTKVNANFTELYDMLGDGSDLTSGISVSGNTITLTTPIIAEIDSGTTITLDATTDIVLDADGGDIFFKDDGTTFGSVTNTSGNLIINSGTTTAATFSGANVTFAGTLAAGVITGTTVEATGDTSTGDNAAIGYTSAEGLILTGQGSTSDITVKNDADATVFTVPTGTDDILFPDSAKAMWGAGSDLQIHHDGSNSIIDEGGSGSLFVRGSTVILGKTGTTEAFFQGAADGAATLYYDNTAALATASGGGTLTGSWAVTTALNPDASDGATLGTTSLEWSDLYLADGGIIYFGDDQDIPLTHVADTGLRFDDSDKLAWGAGSDLTIHSDGTNALLTAATQLTIYTDSFGVSNAGASETMITAINGGAVTLYHNDTAVFATTSTSGGTLTGTWAVTTALTPDASDGAALGTTALEWSDLYLADAAVINFGDDQDVTLTHVADTGLLLNSTRQLQFNDASQYINAPSATVLDINATDEVEVNATLMDINANVEVSGTLAQVGVATFSAASVRPDGSIPLADLDIDGGTDIGAAIVDADLFIIDDGAGGTNRKTTAARVRTYVGFPATTVMLFQQAAAPTGWTKLTATNSEALADASIRVIGSTSFDVGVNGSVAFTTAFASQAVGGNIAGNAGATTLQTAQIPSHTHTVGIGSDNKQSGSSNTGNAGSATQNSGATGGGGSHTHAVGNLAFTGTAINMAVKYVDVILASKDA